MERLKGLDGIVEESAWMIEWRDRVQDSLEGGLGLPLGGGRIHNKGRLAI